MAIVVDSDYSDSTVQSFNLTKDWLIGETILLNTDCNSLGRIFDLNEYATKEADAEIFGHCRSQQVERLQTLSHQLIEKPNRTCLSDAYDTIDFPTRTDKKALCSIIPPQNTLFELSQNKPDRNRWILTFPEDEESSSDDDGFQSASSTVSENKSKLASAPDDHTDLWSQALVQPENKFLTWEQRGSYIYDRTRPFLFDFPLDDRAFQHICLLLLFNKPSIVHRSIDVNYRPIAADEFLRDLCYMLMGIASQTFEWNEIHQTFELKHDVYILGYTPTTIERFSIKYIQAGNRFYLIKQYINQSSKRSDTESEFCQALRYYLRYIQKAIARHDVTRCSLIKFAAQLDPILCSLDLPLSLIGTITDLEKTIRTSSSQTSAAFIKLSSILHSLLNHTLHSIDHNYFLLSVHFLTYTLRPLLSFLTSLIIHSNYLDRYNEYPILFHSNRLTGLKSTNFWTKTLTIRYLHANDTDTIFHQILPIAHLQQIVNITRSLMLIKLCDKDHPLCSITTDIIPKLTFGSIDSVDRSEISEYEREMSEKIAEYEQAQKQKRLDIEQMKVRERMDMYARQDQQRAERKKIIDDAKERALIAKQTLRDQWQEQADKKQKQVKEDKLAETMADAEFNRVTSTTTIIGSRLGTSYDALVQNVRDEIIAEYDAKMRNATEREEQSRQRMQPSTNTNTPKEVPLSISTVSSASTLSFHTPAIDQSPAIVPSIEDKATGISSPSPRKTTTDLIVVTPKEAVPLQSMAKPVLRHTATEQTTEPEYRSTVKLVPSNVLKSTIQNYMMDHHPLDDSQDEEDLPEKVYDWDTIIANGPQFQYEDSFDFRTEETSLDKQQSVQSWSDFDMSPLRVWLEHSVSPLIHVQSQLVNRALLNYFFDELKLLYHLKNLRAYYFLATGRFGLAFCSELSRLLLNNDDVQVIYRVTSMRQILYTSLDQTGELGHLIDILQLTSKMNIPNTLSLLDSSLLDYFELNYTIQWPLNIVISQDMLEKYQIIFRFLLRILIVKQILNEIWVMLKACKQQNATLSSLHQYRHQMQHFLTVFINYITNQVIQIAWNEFMRKIQQAKHINEIAAAHHEYLDRTMLNCLLTPNAAPILNEVNRVLTLIIRFRCQLRTFSWILSATYTDVSDTSVQALRTTFEKYHIAVLSLYKVLSKLVEKGYKTSLADLLIRLNHNGYYDRIATSAIRRP